MTSPQSPDGLTLDAVHKAWHAVGADLAGLNWADFIAALSARQAAEPVARYEDGDLPPADVYATPLYAFSRRMVVDIVRNRDEQWRAALSPAADALPAASEPASGAVLREAASDALQLLERIVGNKEWGAIEEYMDALRAALSSTAPATVMEVGSEGVLNEVLQWALAGHISEAGITGEAGTAIRAAVMEAAAAVPAKPFPAPGAWFPVDVLGHPMREVRLGVWENAKWPSENAVSSAGAEPEGGA